MPRDQPQGEIELFTNQPLRLNKAGGLGVTCISGTIWITVANEPGDIFLRTGQRYVLTSNKLALVEAIASGSVYLRPAGQRWPGRLARILNHRTQLSALLRLFADSRN